MMPRALLIAVFAATAFAQKPAFVEIPAGSFIMGCDPALPCAESLPRKRVEFDRPFQMTKTEITVGEFRAFVKATGYRTDAEKAGDAHNWRAPGFPLRDKQPVVFMSLNDAKAYCEFIGARVPVESEWEYAARAGSTTYHYWGEEIDDRYLWYFNNTDQQPKPVGRKLPTPGDSTTWKATRWSGSSAGRTPASRATVRAPSAAVRTQRAPSPIRPTTANASAPSVSALRSRGVKNSNFRPEERRFDYGIRCAK